MHIPQAGGPSLVGCPRLLIQYIRSYLPYLEAVSSIRNVKTRHAAVTRDPPNMGPSITDFTKAEYWVLIFKKFSRVHVFVYKLEALRCISEYPTHSATTPDIMKSR
jgi:hypothetical protein